MNVAFYLFGSLFVCFIIGIPISVSLGVSSLIGAAILGIPLPVIPQRIFTSLDAASLMAIPFFVLAGNLMTEGGISKHLVSLANSLIGKTRGGLAYAAIVASAFFAALSGSAPATVIAIGATLYPEMVALGYPRERAAGLFVVSGGLGPIIPPSIVMIVYCTISNNSVGNMFKSGVGIGTIIVLMLVIFSTIYSRIEKWPKNTDTFSLVQFIRTLFSAIPALAIPVIILGGIYSGVLTPTESGAVALMYGFIIGFFYYKQINKKTIGPIILVSAKNSAMVLFIIGTSSAFSWIFTFAGISNELVEFISSLRLTSTAFTLTVGFIIVILGAIMDAMAIVVLLVPLLWPIAQSLGLGGIYFGMVVCMGAVIGSMTPPVATGIFAASSFSKLKVGQITRGQMPFFIGFLFVYFLVIIFPPLSTMLL
jgi:C4-dicarboxylate transporter DctM subunit